MKKLLAAFLSLTLLGAAALPSLAAENDLPTAPTSTQKEDVSSVRDELPTGWTIEIDDKAAEARAHIMVPLRAIAEQLGFILAGYGGDILPSQAEVPFFYPYSISPFVQHGASIL